MDKIYDVIILGGGPASMSAGVYAAQMKLDTLLIEKARKAQSVVNRIVKARR